MSPNDSKPRETIIYWGSNPHKDDSPTVREFVNEDAERAYFEGIGAADGWFEMEFVDGPDYKVDADGEIVPLKRGVSTPAAPGERFIIWGENPENGTRPDAYRYETEIEAQAFEDGADDMVGWSKYFLVPDASFKPYSDVDEAMDNLPEEGKKALKNYIDFNEEAVVGNGDMLFVNDSGAFVDTDWSRGGTIENTPLTKEEWEKYFSEALVKGYGISVGDAGLDSEDLGRLADGGLERLPEQAAEDFAKKHNLTPREKSVPLMLF